MHQLTSAFHTMSLCTRPLLIAGFRATAGDDEPIVLDPSTTSLTPEQVRIQLMEVNLLGLDWSLCPPWLLLLLDVFQAGQSLTLCAMPSRSMHGAINRLQPFIRLLRSCSNRQKSHGSLTVGRLRRGSCWPGH